MSTVEQIKEKLNIVDVVGRYIKLEKAGANLKAKCPFHNEKTASFFVSPSRNNYYCFGCNAKGDIFTFVQEFERVDFVEALKILADIAGVKIVYEKGADKQVRSEKEKLLALTESAVNHFEKNLPKNPPALEYLKGRGLKERTISDWRLGYAVDSWQDLLDHLKKAGYSESDIEKAGLIKKGDKPGGGLYDRFRARLMFPIFDSAGRPIAFSGRLLDPTSQNATAGAAKYINSPEGPLFNKSSVLYGYDRAKNPIREQNYAILVEGQMDLLMMHQAGLRNTIASSGTALSEEHLKILKRSSENLLLAYDGDGAGLKAAIRAWNLALSMGMEIKIAPLPKGEDPASIIAKSPEEMKEILQQSKHIIDFYLEAILNSDKDSRKISKKVEKELLPLVRSLASSIDQAHFITNISEKTGIKEEALYEELNKIQVEETSEDSSEKIEIVDEFIARRLWGLLFWQENEKEKRVDQEKIIEKLKEIVGEEEIKRRQASTLEQKASLVYEAELYYGDTTDLQKEAEELLGYVEEDYLKDQFGKAMVELQSAEREKKTEEVAAILKRCHDLSARLSARKKQ